MAEVGALLRRQDGPELPLHLQGVLGAVCDPQPPCDADAVGVADVGGLVINVPQDEVRRLPSHAGQTRELLHGAGDLPVKALQQLPGAADQVPGLPVEEAAGADIGLHLLRLRLGEALQRREAGEERRRHLVYPGIGTLGREPHGEEQLIILLVLQGAEGVGVEAL